MTCSLIHPPATSDFRIRGLSPALLSIKDGDTGSDLAAHITEPRRGLQGRAPRCGDILEQHHPIALTQARALYPRWIASLAAAAALRLLAHEEAAQAGPPAGLGYGDPSERYRSELESADRVNSSDVIDLGVHEHSQQVGAVRVHHHRLHVEEVSALAAAGESERFVGRV